jgi:predicted DNA binding CopG/RHH family protein
MGNRSHRITVAPPVKSRSVAGRILDFSDIPEASDEELRHAWRVGRPATGQAKHLIAIRIAPRLLAELRQMAARQHKPYQTLVHDLLDAAVKRVA